MMVLVPYHTSSMVLILYFTTCWYVGTIMIGAIPAAAAAAAAAAGR